MSDSKSASAFLKRLPLSVAEWFAHHFSKRPGLEGYKEHMLAASDEKPSGLRVTFLGVSTLLFEDGETAILTDGFFTRPGRLRTLFTKLEPDSELIARYLKRAGIEKLDAVIVLHSHLDHAFDAPVVAHQTHAPLIGSESTARIGHAYGFPDLQIQIIQSGETLRFGRFQLKLLPSPHSPLTSLSRFHIHHVLLAGEIEEPFTLPARWYEYREGGSYSLFIEHEGKTMLVQGSAGFEKDALRGQHADVVFLGIGTLGKLDDTYREDYWREVVQAVGAQRIIPVHWDDFTRSLEKPLVPMSRLLDDFDKTMAFLLERASHEKIEVKLLQAWTKVDLFASLPHE